jgi:hypothetical protein
MTVAAWIAAGSVVWCALALGFVLGAWWHARPR